MSKKDIMPTFNRFYNNNPGQGGADAANRVFGIAGPNMQSTNQSFYSQHL